MTVLELLEELEDIVDTASSVPITGKVMVDREEIEDIISSIRQTLPEDVKQANWVKNQQNRILDDAKREYEKLVNEAKKQANILVDDNDITLRAKKHAEEIESSAQDYATMLKIRTFKYLDKLMVNMQNKMDQLNDIYFKQMYDDVANTFDGIDSLLASNRKELAELASRTKDDEEWLYDNEDQDGDYE